MPNPLVRGLAGGDLTGVLALADAAQERVEPVVLGPDLDVVARVLLLLLLLLLLLAAGRQARARYPASYVRV